MQQPFQVADDSSVSSESYCSSSQLLDQPVCDSVDSDREPTSGSDSLTSEQSRSDEGLMRRAQRGDAHAFSLVYERYSLPVLSYLHRMLGNYEDVEAIGQEVFLRAYRFRATYRYPQRLSTWLFTIARNLAINNARRRKRSPVRNASELHLDDMDMGSSSTRVAGNACDAVQKREDIDRIVRALDDLPVDQKGVIMLGVFQDMTYGEMETLTGTKAVTLRSRMFHGLRKLAVLVENMEPEAVR